MQKVFLGKEQIQHPALEDLSMREKLILIPMTVVIIYLGLFPQFVLNTAKAPIKSTLQTTVVTLPIASETESDMKKGGSHE